MGLDMFTATRKEAPATPVDFEREPADMLHQWRKHPNLHGWMFALYRQKGGEDEDFNCAAVQLDLDDLAALELAITTHSLPPTVGYFFGESDGSEVEDDLVFVAKAREAIQQGLTVFYSAWW